MNELLAKETAMRKPIRGFDGLKASIKSGGRQ
jgi:hypothetical protein